MKSLYKMCAGRTLLPSSLQIKLCDYPTGVALYRGGFGDVWKHKHEGREVAVKVLRTYANSDLRKITRVSHGDDQPRHIRPSADCILYRGSARSSWHGGLFAIRMCYRSSE